MPKGTYLQTEFHKHLLIEKEENKLHVVLTKSPDIHVNRLKLMTNENILLHIRIFYGRNAHLPHIQIRFGSGSEISLLKVFYPCPFQ